MFESYNNNDNNNDNNNESHEHLPVVEGQYVVSIGDLPPEVREAVESVGDALIGALERVREGNGTVNDIPEIIKEEIAKINDVQTEEDPYGNPIVKVGGDRVSTHIVFVTRDGKALFVKRSDITGARVDNLADIDTIGAVSANCSSLPLKTPDAVRKSTISDVSAMDQVAVEEISGDSNNNRAYMYGAIVLVNADPRGVVNDDPVVLIDPNNFPDSNVKMTSKAAAALQSLRHE